MCADGRPRPPQSDLDLDFALDLECCASSLRYAPGFIIQPVSTPTKSATKSALRKASLFYFVWVMFSYCTGGPFGLEDMVTTSGPGLTLIYLLIIPSSGAFRSRWFPPS